MDLLVITYISSGIIILVFLFLLFSTSRVRKYSKLIKAASEEENPLEYLDTTKLAPLMQAYSKTISFDIEGEKKSMVPSNEYFTEQQVCGIAGINTRLVDTGSGTLVGLGLLGTFFGLTLGIMGFDSSTTDNIQLSINSLLAGMGTAFSTSLVGMAGSLIYSFFEKKWRNKLVLNLFFFNEKVDSLYFIDDNTIEEYNQNKLFEKLSNNVKDLLDNQSNKLIDSIKTLLSYRNSEGKEVLVANSIREILINNEEQTKALKSFSTDLALELNNGFDEVLSRQMQQKILPLMESVDATTRSVVEHIDQMALQVSNPATDMIGQVVAELKNAVATMINEFKTSISNGATKELENLAASLSSATQLMDNFPHDMEKISETLKLTIEEVKKAVTEITNSSALSNETAMTKMQEQIVFATTSISEAINEVKQVMSGITTASQDSSTQLIQNLSKTSTEMSLFMQGTMEKISETLKNSMSNMTDSLANKQMDFMALQEESIGEIKKVVESLTASAKTSSLEVVNNLQNGSEQMIASLEQTMKAINDKIKSTLDSVTKDISLKQMELAEIQNEVTNKTQNLLISFNGAIEKLERTNTSINGTMSTFGQAQGEITSTTAHLSSITGDMKIASEVYKASQIQFMNKLETLEGSSKEKMDELLELMKSAGNTTNEYSEKFEIIRKGLSDIFAQIQNGLSNYSVTIRSSIQQYLDAYSKNLTETTSALASTIQQQNEMVEMLVDTVNRKR